MVRPDFGVLAKRAGLQGVSDRPCSDGARIYQIVRTDCEAGLVQVVPGFQKLSVNA